MDSPRGFTNFSSDSDELEYQIVNSDRINSQTSESSPESLMLSVSVSSPPDSFTSDIGTNYSSTENSMLSNGTYDGSGETSDDSFEVSSLTAAMTAYEQSGGLPQECNETAAAAAETSGSASEASLRTQDDSFEVSPLTAAMTAYEQSGGLPQEYNETAAAAAAAAAETSGSASEASLRTQDEFPEITQLETLFELFETCPLTEEQKDSLYDQLLQGLFEDRRKLREMELNYERREKFIKEFEAARKAADQAKMNVQKPEPHEPEPEEPEPVAYVVIHPDEAGPSAPPTKKKNLKKPQKGNGKRGRPAFEKGNANGKTPKTDNPRPEETVPAPQRANLNAAEVIPVTAEQHLSIQGAASAFELENCSSEESSDVEENSNYPLRITPLYPNTKIILPGPDNAHYDIEVSIQPDIRGIQRPGVDANEISNDPAILSCFIPQIHVVVEEISPDTLEERLNRNVNPNADSNDEHVPQQPPESP